MGLVSVKTTGCGTPVKRKRDPSTGSKASLTVTPVAYLQSDFTGRFGIPRQSGLIPEARAWVVPVAPWDREDSLSGIAGFSHLWLLSWLDAAPGAATPTVRPPRLGGARRLGVFASRSPVRPNPLGLSVVALRGVVRKAGRTVLEVEAPDLLDGTPILDIKPYLPYSDRVEAACAPVAFAAPPAADALTVRFAAAAEEVLALHPDGDRLRRLITAMIGLDPRPAWDARSRSREYGLAVMAVNVRWRVEGATAEVLRIDPDRGGYGQSDD